VYDRRELSSLLSFFFSFFFFLLRVARPSARTRAHAPASERSSVAESTDDAIVNRAGRGSGGRTGDDPIAPGKSWEGILYTRLRGVDCPPFF